MISGIIKPLKIVMKRISLLSSLLFVFVWTNGQDKDLEAQMHYTSAEDKYTKGTIQNYEDCFDELGKAEALLGKTNPKILYLKIKALSSVIKLNEPYYFHDGYYYYDIDTCLKTFFNITDAKSYPAEKYTEILNIKDLFKKRGFSHKEYFDTLKMSFYKNSDDGLLGHAQFLWACTKEFFLNDKSQAASDGKTGYFLSPHNFREHGFSDSAELFPEFLRARKILIELSKKGNIDAMFYLAQADAMLDYKYWESDIRSSPRLEADEKFLQKLAETGNISSMRLLSRVYQSYANNILSSKKDRKEASRVSKDWEKKANNAYKLKYGHN